MALKLLTTLTVLILACFAYKVWEKTKVPADVPPQDVWKVKTIDFCLKIVGRLIASLDYFGYDTHYLRPFLSLTFDTMHAGPWPLSVLYKNPKDSDVVVYHRDIAGVQTTIYENRKHRENNSKGVFVYFHGGGWEWLDAENPGPTLRAITRELGFLSVSVDYRLVPEHVFPAAYHDCLNVTRYIINNHEEFKIDPSKVIIAGDSTGGNLAAAVGQTLKKSLRLQVLIYPLLQAFDYQTSSYKENAKVLKHILEPWMTVTSTIRYGGLNPSYVKTFLENGHVPNNVRSMQYREHLISVPSPNTTNTTTLEKVGVNSTLDNTLRIYKDISSKVMNPEFMPLMAEAEALGNITDAYIITAQHDILRDDGLMYGKRLHESTGVKVILENYSAAFHTFFHFSSGPLQLNEAKKALNDLIIYIKTNISEE